MLCLYDHDAQGAENYSASAIVALFRETNRIKLFDNNTPALYSKKPFIDCCVQHPDAVILTLDEAAERIAARDRAKYCRGWNETTRDHYWEMLEVLPPDDWQTVDGIESFKMSERLTGDLTAIYATVGTGETQRYFNMTESCTMPAAEISASLREHLRRRK